MRVAFRTLTVTLSGEVYDLIGGVSRVCGDHALVATYPHLFGPTPSRKSRAAQSDSSGAARRWWEASPEQRWWLRPAALGGARAEKAAVSRARPRPAVIGLTVSTAARDAIITEMLRLDRDGVEVAGWISGHGTRYTWQSAKVVRAGAASRRNGPHSVRLDLDEYERQVRFHDAEDETLELIGDFHSQPHGHNEPSDHDLRAWCGFFEWAEERGLTRYVGPIATHDHRPGRYRPATLTAYVTRRDERGRVTERTHIA